jgi:hypothetical protein
MYSPASSTHEFQRPVLHFLVPLTMMLAMFPTSNGEQGNKQSDADQLEMLHSMRA